MPLYEYTCQQCGRRFSWLIGVIADPTLPTCPSCGAALAEKRAVSRFARGRSEAQALSELAEIDNGSLGDPGDPRVMRDWAQEMGALTGAEGGLGDDFAEYIEEAAADERSSLGDVRN